MGSPETEVGRDGDEPQHKVQITKPFYLSATEVTQAQYEEVMGNHPSGEPVRRVHEGVLPIYLRVDLRQSSILTGMRALGHIRQFVA